MGCETSQKRTAACKSMLDYGFANFALYTPMMQEGAAVPVELGISESVAAVPGEEVSLLVEKGQKDGITTEMSLENVVTAPVSRGQRLGTLTVRAGEQVLRQIPLVAEEEIPRLSFFQLTGKLLRRITMAKEAG